MTQQSNHDADVQAPDSGDEDFGVSTGEADPGETTATLSGELFRSSGNADVSFEYRQPPEDDPGNGGGPPGDDPGDWNPPDDTDYDVIELSRGEHRVERVSSGETFENVLIDQRASNCSFTLSATSNNWTIRNVGWLGAPKGANNAGGAGEDYLILCGGDGLIENCFMDAKSPSYNTYFGAVYLSQAHRGHIDMRNTYIAGFGNNAAYANMPAVSGGGGGTITYSNCYHRDNTPANFRPGATGSVVENCLSITDDPSGQRGLYYSNDSQYCRGIWHWDGVNCEVRNSTVYVNPSDVQPGPAFVARNQHGTASHVDLNVNDCYVNDDVPTLSITQGGSASVNFSGLTRSVTASVVGDGGVPMSAEMAAQGLRERPDPFGEGL